MKKSLLHRRTIYLVAGLFLVILSGTYKHSLAIALNQATPTNTPGTVPTFTPTDTPIPVTDTPTNTPLPATNTPLPVTDTPTGTPPPIILSPTDTPPPPTHTATNTPLPVTNTPLPATVTATNTPLPANNTPTHTPLPATQTPTNTPAAATSVPTNTSSPATDTPTNTPVQATATNAPPPHHESATDTPTATRTPAATVAPTPLSEPSSLAQAIAQVINYPALFPDSYPPLVDDFDLDNYQDVTEPVTVTITSGTYIAELMVGENEHTVVAVTKHGKTLAYPINTKSPIYKAARFLDLIPVSAEVTVEFRGKHYRAIMVFDPTTGELSYLVAKITTAVDGKVTYGVVLKLDISDP